MNDAMVVISGGQDSTTCLYWAKQNFVNVEAITFNYGQVHHLEGRAVENVCNLAKVPLARFSVEALFEIAGGGLTQRGGDVLKKHPQFDLPASFVPLRNLVLFSLAAAFAVKVGCKNLVVGTNQTDYSGYPDCREGFTTRLEQLIDIALDDKPVGQQIEKRVKFHAPLLHLTKAQTVKLAKDLPGCWEALAYTHTCYKNEYPPCGECPACVLRAKGFAEAGFEDPLITRYRKEIEDNG